MQPCLYCPHHVVLLFKNMFLYYIWHPFIICFITSQIKSPKFVLCLFAIATWIFYVFYTLVYFFVRIYYLNMFNKLLIGFLDLKNICFDTNIIEIGTFLAVLERKLYFMAAILNFQLFGGKKWRDSVVPGSFEFSIVQSPMLLMFMLLSGCARTRHFLLHIRPTNKPRPSAQERHVTLPLALSPILYLLSLIHCQLIFISINVLSGHLIKLVCLMLLLYDLISCLYF